MGIDLYLLPVNGDHAPSLFFAHSLIPLDRTDLLREIRAVADRDAVDIPQPLSCYFHRLRNGEYGYGLADKDPYGAPLQYVLAKHLKPLAKKKRNHSPLNKASMAFVAALPDYYKLVLYWH